MQFPPSPALFHQSGRQAGCNLCLFAGLAELFCSLVFFIFPLASPAFRYLGNIWESDRRFLRLKLSFTARFREGRKALSHQQLSAVPGRSQDKASPSGGTFLGRDRNRKDCRGFSRFVRRLSAFFPKGDETQTAAHFSPSLPLTEIHPPALPSRESAESILSSLRVQNGRIHFGDKPEKRQIAAELKKRERVLKE